MPIFRASERTRRGIGDQGPLPLPKCSIFSPCTSRRRSSLCIDRFATSVVLLRTPLTPFGIQVYEQTFNMVSCVSTTCIYCANIKNRTYLHGICPPCPKDLSFSDLLQCVANHVNAMFQSNYDEKAFSTKPLHIKISSL